LLINIVSSSQLPLLRIAVEVIIHLIQPYPFIKLTWKLKILGNDVTYSLSMLLFAACIVRLYVVVKLMKYWSQFTNEKGLRVFKLFNNKLVYLFFYKSSIRKYGFLALSVIFFAFIYVSSLIFKIFEHYTPPELLNQETIRFSNFLNCLWFLVVTMTTSKSILI
jgi:hypothetical protein